MQIAEGSRGTGRLVSASEGVRLRRPLSRGEAGVNYLLWRTQQERERVRGGATSAVIERTDQDSRYTVSSTILVLVYSCLVLAVDATVFLRCGCRSFVMRSSNGFASHKSRREGESVKSRGASHGQRGNITMSRQRRRGELQHE